MKHLLTDAVKNALEKLNFPDDLLQFETPKNPEHGDFATNLALTLAKPLSKNPREIAQMIVQQLENDNNRFIEDISIAGPGFINFKLKTELYQAEIKTIITNMEYGKSCIGAGKTALVEFVSANPTGPLTVGHGRGAVLGDTVSNILEWNGFSVNREYYFNNAGRQMRILGESVRARYFELCGENIEFPEDGYEGEYIRDIAKHLFDENGDSLLNENSITVFKDAAEKSVFNDIKESMSNIGLSFDSFFNEYELYESGAIDDVITSLRDKKLIFEKDDATWFKAELVGRPQDKVLIKKTGEPTYRLPDIAYHQNKFGRNFDVIVDVFGADHSDTWPDVLALVKQLGHDTDKIRVLIHQFVTLTKSGAKIKMSTRKANFVTLEELCNETGPDVLRYFFVMRGMNSHLNFDLDLAKNQSDENPVFYIQYAHARICNILKRAKGFGTSLNPDADLTGLNSEIEIQLMKKLIEFPDIVEKTCDTLEPQNIANYLQEVCTVFHKFYVLNKVISEDEALTAARLIVTEASRIVIKNGLTILGISAPERM